MQDFESEIDQENFSELAQIELEMEENDKKRFQFVRNLWSIYDKRTLLLIGLTFFNEGNEFMTTLAVTIQFF